MKLLRYDSDDPGDFFEAAIEFMRGNSESTIKSSRNLSMHNRKREAARNGKSQPATKAMGDGCKVLTRRLPAWIELVDGKPVLIPERAAVVKRIYKMAALGYGHASIVKRLTDDKVPSFGNRETYIDSKGKERIRAVGGTLGAGQWTRSYVALLLKDRRVVGEYQPRLQRGDKAGDVIPDYFPAVVTEDEWLTARAGVEQRKQKPGRIGDHGVNIFSGLLKNTRGTDSYIAVTRTDGHKPGRRGSTHRVLINADSAQGRTKCMAFPFDTFERALLTCLREIDPHSILNGDSGPDETIVLGAKLNRVETKIAEIEAELLHGDVAALAKVLRALEQQQRDLSQRLAEARQKALHPLSETWGQTQSLIDVLDNAPDPTDARLRLRSALRRIVGEDGSIRLLVVPRGRDRLCAVQIWFAGGKRCRTYLILHRPPNANGKARTPGYWQVRSWLTIDERGAVDLSTARGVEDAERYLKGRTADDQPGIAAALVFSQCDRHPL
jgi:hypothetical protein